MEVLTAEALIEILKTVPPKTPIVLSSDQEGNSYRQAYSFSTDHNFKDREIGLRELTAEDTKQGYTEEDLMTDGEPCVCLW